MATAFVLMAIVAMLWAEAAFHLDVTMPEYVKNMIEIAIVAAVITDLAKLFKD